MQPKGQAKVKWAEPVVVIASGPSLTKEDCYLVELSGLLTVAVNSVYIWCPWAEVIYAGDHRFWKSYDKDVIASGFAGKRYSRSSRAEKEYGAKYVKSKLGSDYNSGQMAIEMAIRFGADPVIMLGFDCSLEGGTHFHGDHTKTPNPNKERVRRWHDQFLRIPKHYPSSSVINCSRKTALDCFEKADIEATLKSVFESAPRRRRAS